MASNPIQTDKNETTQLTININGPDFPFKKFQQVLDSFSTVLSEIDKEISDTGKEGVEWSISEVRQGSICLTVEASIVKEDVEIDRPQEIIKAFQSGLDVIKDNPIRPKYFNDISLKKARVFSELIDPNDFAEIGFSPQDWRFNVTKNLSVNIDEIIKRFHQYYGAIEGKLVSISIAGRHKIGIRGQIENKIIPCFLPDELLETARNALGKRVYVFGLIREYLHGEKINIQVQEIKLLPEPSDSLSVANILNMMRGEN
ncbi:MAG: hypothetical protein QNJ42_05300 [Crocosphaera sp.]|nr:hypothetical protein [Crocosphaera sp.]